MKKIVLMLGLSTLFIKAIGQGVFIPVGHESYLLMDRFEVLSGKIPQDLHSGVKPFQRMWVPMAFEKQFPKGHQSQIQYLLNDNPEWNSGQTAKQKGWRGFYKSPNALVYIPIEKDFLIINPVLDLGISRDGNQWNTVNTRGVEVRGTVGGKLGYYSYLTENQIYLKDFVQARVDSMGLTYPGAGLIKPFKRDQKPNGWDYFISRGHLSFSPIKGMDIQFGNDQFFFGNGIRSLILSDFSKDFLSLRAVTRVGKVQYTNLFGKLNDFQGQIIGRYTVPKYMAMHHLSINAGKRWNIGFFESVIFNRNDSLGGGGYDLSYLNPVIFYRSVEHNLNSTDNVVLGADLKWHPAKGISIYGQFILDEFLLRKFISRQGYWQNKYGIQAGMKYFDVANVNGLDLQVEFNEVRPYTFSHFEPSSSYTHYGQPLAHPLGANFRELTGLIRYAPGTRFWTTLRWMYAIQGQDTGKSNWGSQTIKDNHTRQRVGNPWFDQGHFIGQGLKTTTQSVQLLMSYRIAHQVWIDVDFIWRKRIAPNSHPGYQQQGSYAGFRLRANIHRKEPLY